MKKQDTNERYVHRLIHERRHSMPAKKPAQDAKSWEELKNLTTLEEVLAALKAKETNRLAHKKYYLRRQELLSRAKELQKEKPELFQNV